MARAPVQARGKVKMERIVAAAQHMLADLDAPATLRSLAERAGVSLGTVYQYFESMDAVRDEVGRRAASIVRATLGRHVPAGLAAQPDQFFAALIASLDAMQRAHPELGCMVRVVRRSAFVEELAQSLQDIVRTHVKTCFSGQATSVGLSQETKLDMALASMIALLAQAPDRESRERELYLSRVSETAASLMID